MASNFGGHYYTYLFRIHLFLKIFFSLALNFNTAFI